MPETKRFKINNDIYNIPLDKIETVLEQNPNAQEVERFVVGEDTVNIPLDILDAFHEQFPQARPVSSVVGTEENQQIKEDLKSNDVNRFESAMGHISQSFFNSFGDVGKSLAILAAQPSGVDPTNFPSYRFGEQLQKTFQRVTPTNPEFQDEFITSTLPSAVGSMAFFLLTSWATKGALGLGVKGAVIASGVAGAASMSGSAWDEAMEATGGDRDIAWKTYLINAGLGSTEAIPLGFLFSKWDRASGRLLSTFIKNWTTRKGLITGTKEGGIEFLQEFGQTIGQNFTAQQLFDFERDVLEGAFEGGAAGFILGTVLSGAGVGAQIRKAKKKGITTEELELIDEAYNNIEDNVKTQATALLSPEDVRKQIISEANQMQSQIIEEADFAQEEQRGDERSIDGVVVDEGLEQLKGDDLLTDEERYYRDNFGVEEVDINIKRADDVVQEIGMDMAEVVKELDTVQSETEAVEAGGTEAEIQELKEDLTDSAKETITDDIEAIKSNIIDTEVDPQGEIEVQEGSETTIEDETIREDSQEVTEESTAAEKIDIERLTNISERKWLNFIDDLTMDELLAEQQNLTKIIKHTAGLDGKVRAHLRNLHDLVSEHRQSLGQEIRREQEESISLGVNPFPEEQVGSRFVGPQVAKISELEVEEFIAEHGEVAVKFKVINSPGDIETGFGDTLILTQQVKPDRPNEPWRLTGIHGKTPVGHTGFKSYKRALMAIFVEQMFGQADISTADFGRAKQVELEQNEKQAEDPLKREKGMFFVGDIILFNGREYRVDNIESIAQAMKDRHPEGSLVHLEEGISEAEFNEMASQSMEDPRGRSYDLVAVDFKEGDPSSVELEVPGVKLLDAEIVRREEETSVEFPTFEGTATEGKSTQAVKYGVHELKAEDVPAWRAEIERLAIEMDVLRKAMKGMSKEQSVGATNTIFKLSAQKQLLIEALSAHENKFLNYSIQDGWVEGNFAPQQQQEINEEIAKRDKKQERENKKDEIENNKTTEYINQNSTDNVNDEHQEDNIEDPDDQHFSESVEDAEPSVGANSVTVQLFSDGVIEKDQVLETALRIRNRARKMSQKAFTEWIRSTYPNIDIDNAYIAKTYRRENTLEEMKVLDIDAIFASPGVIADMYIGDSSFHDHKSKRKSNKYLIDEVLLPFLNELAIFNIYESSEFGKDDVIKKKIMPFDRSGSLKMRDLHKEDLRHINNLLLTKGYTLLPLSDADTFMAVKIPTDILKKKVSKEDKMSEARDRFLTKVLGFWYDGEMSSNDLAKRFKLFLPKGEKLKFNRDLRLQFVDDLIFEGRTKPDGTPLVITDGTTFANPSKYKEFLQYNEMDGNIKQHKTIITHKDDNKLVAIKHLTHVLSVSEWNRLVIELGIDKDVDMVVFDSAAKIANKANGDRIANKEIFELPAESFRHIFTGNNHEQTTFSRQIFNYFGSNSDVIQHAIDKVIDPIANDVKLEYESFEKSPRTLQEHMQAGMRDIPEDISDIRRYIKMGAVHFKSLRNAVRSFLKSRLIDKKFIKLQQQGNFSYLKPDLYGEVALGDIHVPDSEFVKIFHRAYAKGFTKYGPDFTKFSSIKNRAEKGKQLDRIKADLNVFLRTNPVEVLTFRPPIPKIDNVQVLKIRRIRDKNEGNAAIMNTVDAILNKEADFDGDEVFFHYLDNDTDLQKIADYIQESKNSVGEVTLTTLQSGAAIDNDALYQSGENAGVGKKAVGEAAKAISAKAILLANNVKIGKFEVRDKQDNVRIVYNILTEENKKNAKQIFDLQEDWSDWDWKMAHTLQGAVDNLKTGSLTEGDDWIVEDGIILYNRADIYAQMFQNGEVGIVDALKPILDALTVFSGNFDEGGTWDQNQVNAVAKKYRMNTLVERGYLGKSPQERMILHLADMGFLPGDKINQFGKLVDESPKLTVMNSIHDNAHNNAINSFLQQYIEKTPASNLKETTKKKTQEFIKQLYVDKARIDKKQSTETYATLFELYGKKLDQLPDAIRDYADYLIMRGYTAKEDLSGATIGNTRFILQMVSNKNLQRFTDIFNKEYNRLWDAKRGSVEGHLFKVGSGTLGFLGGGFEAPDTALSYRFKKAIANFFNRVLVDLKYGVKDQAPYNESVGIVDSINKQLYEIGRLPFSDAVPMRKLYEKVARTQGVDLTQELTAGYGKAVLVELGLSKFNKYLFFTEDIFVRNPYTARFIKSINDDSNRKDADTDRFLGQLSNTEQNDKIRELLDVKKKGVITESRMHAATKVLDMFHEYKRQFELGNLKKADKILKDITDIKHEDKHLEEQILVLDDFVMALDGQRSGEMSENETVEEFKDRSRAEERRYLLNKHGEDVAKAYDLARVLLDDIIDYDLVTWDENIGDPDNETYEVVVDNKVIKRQSWQYKELQKLRQQLRKSGWTDSKIEKLIEDVKIFRPKVRSNYYPHVYFGYDMDGGGDLDFLHNHETFSSDEMSEFAKGIRNWKQRRRDTQTLETMADRNPFSVIARRVSSSVNARWTNKFKKNYRDMLLNIRKGMKKEAIKGSPDTLQTLIELRTIADKMYEDVSKIPQFSWVKSASNVIKGLYLTNLLLFSVRGILRNKTQGLGPNIIEFGGENFLRALKFDGKVVLADGEELQIFNDLGISRADIFAKAEGGQEWDIYKSYRDIISLQEASKKGGGAKFKVLVKQYMQMNEARMNKFVKIAGENNVFSMVAGIGKKVAFSVLRKTGKDRYIIPEMPSTKRSFSGVEKTNRRYTGAMAFLQSWENLRAAQSDIRRGMNKSDLADLDRQNYQDALKNARNMIDKVQFNYNMWNRPIGIRGPIKSTIFQFKSFTLGMIKLHWNWWFDVWHDPRGEYRKAIWFLFLGMATEVGSRFFEKDFWRFFELPELEFMENFNDWLWGNANEKKWAWYGNRASPITGPAGGMIFEAMIGLGLADKFGMYDSDPKRKFLAWMRIIEAHVPFAREANDLSMRMGQAIQGDISLDEAILQYIGLFDDKEWIIQKPKKPSPNDKGRYKGAVRELFK